MMDAGGHADQLQHRAVAVADGTGSSATSKKLLETGKTHGDPTTERHAAGRVPAAI